MVIVGTAQREEDVGLGRAGSVAASGVVHAYMDQKVTPPNLIVRWFTLLKVKLWFITLPYD
jgi:hypothetical protein